MQETERQAAPRELIRQGLLELGQGHVAQFGPLEVAEILNQWLEVNGKGDFRATPLSVRGTLKGLGWPFRLYGVGNVVHADVHVLAMWRATFIQNKNGAVPLQSAQEDPAIRDWPVELEKIRASIVFIDSCGGLQKATAMLKIIEQLAERLLGREQSKT